jgi:PhzF family phenazine biosynthesis protein
VQECGAGLVRVRRGRDRLAFVAPPLLRSGPLEEDHLARVVDALGLAAADVVDAAWVDNGPGWCALLLRTPRAVLAADPDPVRASGMKVGLAARHPDGTRSDGVGVEVRAFYSDGRDLAEDPVTGSLNAGLAQWLVPAGHLPPHYVAAQGTLLGRHGRVHVDVDGDEVLVGGATRTLVVGERPG